MNEDKIIQKLDDHGKLLSDHGKKLDEHNKQFDRVITKLIEHDGRFDRIENKMDGLMTKEDGQKINQTLEHVVTMVKMKEVAEVVKEIRDEQRVHIAWMNRMQNQWMSERGSVLFYNDLL